MLQEHEKSIANQMAKYEEQMLLLASVSQELKQQQQANSISYQAYIPPSMQDHQSRTRLIASESNYRQPANRQSFTQSQRNRQQPTRRQGQGRSNQRTSRHDNHPATYPADAALTSELTNQEFDVQQREHAQLLALNGCINPPHGIGGAIPGGFGLNYCPNLCQRTSPPDPNRTEKHYRLNNNHCWTHGYDIGDTHTHICNL